MTQEPFLCTPQELEDFKKSNVYHDFRLLVDLHIELLKASLEQETSTLEIYRTQGKLMEVRGLLEFPERLKLVVTEQREREKRNGE